MPGRRQAIIWTNDGYLLTQYASLGLNVLAQCHALNKMATILWTIFSYTVLPYSHWSDLYETKYNYELGK